MVERDWKINSICL